MTIADFKVTDDGIIIPQSTPSSSPPVGGTQLYADSATGLLTQKLPDGSISPLSSRASAMVYVGGFVVDAAAYTLIDIDLTAYTGYKMLQFKMFFTAIDNSARVIHGRFNNDTTANAYVHSREGTTQFINTYMNHIGRSPDADHAYYMNTRFMTDLWLWDYDSSTTWLPSFYFDVATTDRLSRQAGRYNGSSVVNSLQLYESGNRIFGIGTEIQIWGLRTD